MTFKTPDKFRLRVLGLPPGDECNGMFSIPLRRSQTVMVIASNGCGWEHVSVSRRDRTPTWDEMCQVKALFWDDEDCVMQLHPPRSEWVNNHPNCLHLWRPVDTALPMPPSILVGIKAIGVLK